jgi:hypothetical protein
MRWHAMLLPARMKCVLPVHMLTVLNLRQSTSSHQAWVCTVPMREAGKVHGTHLIPRASQHGVQGGVDPFQAQNGAVAQRQLSMALLQLSQLSASQLRYRESSNGWGCCWGGLLWSCSAGNSIPACIPRGSGTSGNPLGNAQSSPLESRPGLLSCRPGCCCGATCCSPAHRRLLLSLQGLRLAGCSRDYRCARPRCLSAATGAADPRGTWALWLGCWACCNTRSRHQATCVRLC